MIVKHIKSISRFFADHWYGRLSLFISVSIVLLLIRALIWFVPAPFDAPIIIYSLIGLNILVLVWQIVGTLRSADAHLKSDNSSLLAMFAYLAIVGACLLVALQTADWLTANHTVKISQESLLTRPLPKTNTDKTELYLEGQIDFEMNNALGLVLNKTPTIQTIKLNSDGGAIYAARAIAIQIIANKLNTHIDKKCNSACTLIFMAGNKRTIDKNGAIGFHQYQDNQMNPLTTAKVTDEQDKDIIFFSKRGASDLFLKQLFQANHTEIWIPDRATLQSEGIINSN